MQREQFYFKIGKLHRYIIAEYEVLAVAVAFAREDDRRWLGATVYRGPGAQLGADAELFERHGLAVESNRQLGFAVRQWFGWCGSVPMSRLE